VIERSDAFGAFGMRALRVLALVRCSIRRLDRRLMRCLGALQPLPSTCGLCGEIRRQLWPEDRRQLRECRLEALFGTLPVLRDSVRLRPGRARRHLCFPHSICGGFEGSPGIGFGSNGAGQCLAGLGERGCSFARRRKSFGFRHELARVLERLCRRLSSRVDRHRGRPRRLLAVLGLCGGSGRSVQICVEVSPALGQHANDGIADRTAIAGHEPATEESSRMLLLEMAQLLPSSV
jgi:hypothetical protein